MSILGDRIKILRDEIELTQEQLGDKFFVTKGTVSKWENDHRIPELDTISKLATLFDVSVDYLLGRTNKRQPHHLTKEDIIKIAPEYARMLEEGGLEYLELVEELQGKEIPLEAIKELVDTILKYRNSSK